MIVKIFTFKELGGGGVGAFTTYFYVEMDVIMFWLYSRIRRYRWLILTTLTVFGFTICESQLIILIYCLNKQ